MFTSKMVELPVVGSKVSNKDEKYNDFTSADVICPKINQLLILITTD